MAALMGQDPLSMAAPILKGGPGALDIGYKRMGIEAELNKQSLAAKAAEDATKQKEKAANQKANKWEPAHVDLIHSEEWLKLQAERDRQEAELRMNYKTLPPTDPRNLGDPDDPTTEAGMQMRRRKVQDAQYVANSQQLGEAMKKDIELARTRPGEFTKEDGSPITENDIIQAYGKTSITDSARPNVMDNNFKLQPYLDKRAEVLGTSSYENAVLNPDGTVTTTGNEGVDLSKIIAEARAAAIDDFANPALGKQLKDLADNDPEGFSVVQAIAKKQNLPLVGAMAFQQLFDRAGGRKHTESQTMQNSVGAGRQEEMDKANELVQVYKNVFNQDSRQYDARNAFPEWGKADRAKLVNNNPALKDIFTFDASGDVVLKPGNHIIKDFNRLAVGETEKLPGLMPGTYTPGQPKMIQFAIQNDKTGNVVVASATPLEFEQGKVDLSPAMDKHQLVSDVIMPAAEKYGNPYTIRGLEDAFQRNGINIKTRQISADNRDIKFKKPESGARGGMDLTEEQSKELDF